MSSKTRNAIAIIVSAVAVLAVIAVIVLASITIIPSSYGDGWLEDRASVVIYRDGTRLPGEDENGKLVGDGEDSGLYTYDDLFATLNFSLFSACLQFNYDFGLELTGDTAASSRVSVSDISTAYDSVVSGDTTGYSVVIRFNEIKTMTLVDDSGKTVTQEYDTVMFTLAEDSEWVRNITAYAYLDSDVHGSSDDFGIASKDYYTVRFGAKTSDFIDMLDDVFDVPAAPEEDEDDTTDDGTTDDGTDDGTGDTTGDGSGDTGSDSGSGDTSSDSSSDTSSDTTA